MIVFYSMIFVILILMFIYRSQQPVAKIRIEKPIPWGYAIVAMGYIVFWAALRSGFVDTSAYIRQFQSMPVGLKEAYDVLFSDVKDKGFVFLQIVFKTTVSRDFHMWLALIAVATAVPIMVVFRNRSVVFLYSMFLFVCSTTVVWMFNGIRQLLVAALMFGFGYLIEERKFVKFLIVLFICATIHGTAWLMMPMYFFVTDKPFGKRMLIFIFAVLACAVSVAPLMDSMETVLEDTHYSGNLKQFAEDDGVHPLRVLFSCIPVVLAVVRRKQIMSLNNRYINMCVNMSTIAAGLYFVGMFTSGIMIGRLPIYFVMYSYVLFPYLFEYVYKEAKSSLYFVISMVYLVFFYLMTRNIYYISDILGNYA